MHGHSNIKHGTVHVMYTQTVTLYCIIISCVSVKTAEVYITCVQSVLRHSFLILYTHHPDTLYLRERGCFSKPKGGPRAKKWRNNALRLQWVPDSSVGMWTRYGLRTPVEARFSAPIQTSHGAHPTSYTTGTGSSPGIKPPGSGVNHPPHLEPRLKKQYR